MNKFFTPTRDAALSRLSAFTPKMGRTYASRRNFDLGQGRHEDVSALSPWVRHRLVSEQELAEAALGAHGYPGAEKFIQEVFWRSYWKGWLERRPHIWRAYQKDVVRLLDSTSANDTYASAVNGRTGIACFDHWVEELRESGYLHNHARMWFASIWIFTLKLPWALGANFFMRHLLDGDPASNTLSWRWVGGLQTADKIYLARANNIATFTEGRFNPEGQLATQAKPLGEPTPGPLADVPDPQAPDPEAPTILIVHEDDLSYADHMATLNIVGKAVICGAHRRTPDGVNDIVGEFVNGCIADALGRDDIAPETTFDDPDISDLAPIRRWIIATGATQTVAMYAPTGPARDTVDTVNSVLADDGIQHRWVLRDWDRLCWPHATHGFFRFKKQVPAILSTLDQ